jgi:hypothetical protein
MAFAYGNLTTDQLRAMLDAAHANHRQQLAETKAKWAAEVAALQKKDVPRQDEVGGRDGDAAASQRRFET